MSQATSQIQTEIPMMPMQPQPPQGDSLTTLIIAIAFLIKTTALSIAVIIKANKG
jgi:hypothetical protein